MSTNANRFFTVAKIGLQGSPSVEIREVAEGASDFTLPRAEAWKLANKLAQPINVRGGAKHPALNLYFTGLNGMRTDLGTAAIECENAKAVTELKKNAEVIAEAVEPKWLESDENKAIAVFLGQEATAKPNSNFIQSVWSYFLKNQRLTDGQAAAIKRNMVQAEERKAQVTEVAKEADNVPAGRYAIERTEGKIEFYKIEKGKAGTRWEGFTFVKVQASDEVYPVKSPVERNDILAHIADDIPAAMALYGVEIGKCGHCHRTLTSEWRKKGIGPVCVEKMGW